MRRLVELVRRFRRLVRGRERVMIDDRVEELSEELSDKEGDLALAHREIACSTTAAMAVNRPPNSDGSDDEDEGAIDSGLIDPLGGSPRKMSASSLSSMGGSSEDWTWSGSI